MDTVREIPELLEKPVIVIDFKKGSNAKIVMGDLHDEHDNIVTAVPLLTPTSNKGNVLDIIKISSAEGRSHIKSLFTNEDGSPVAIRYMDKKRIQSWLNVNRLQLPLHNLDLDSNNSIDETTLNVNSKMSLGEDASGAVVSGSNIYGADVALDSAEQDAPAEQSITEGVRLPQKAAAEIAKEIKISLGVPNNRMYEVHQLIEAYAKGEISGREELYRQLKESFGTQQQRIVNEDAKQVRDYLHNYRLQVSDSIKSEIPDFRDLMRRARGLGFSQKAQKRIPDFGSQYNYGGLKIK